MPVFNWEGTTNSGETRKGNIRASDADEARNRLRDKNIEVTKIKKKKSSGGFSFDFGGRVPQDRLVVFTRQFATMIDAGLPLVKCLELLGENEEHKTFKRIIQEVQDDIEQGTTLSDAMAKHPGAFDSLYCNLVAAGEVAGILDSVMARLAQQIEKAQQLRRQIKSAFTYPIIVLVVAIVIVIGMLYKIIPTFAEMFDDMGDGDAELPGPTQFVMGLSEFVQANFIFIGLGIVGFVLLVGFILKYEPTRAVFDDVLLKVPIFGDLVKKTATARFTRTLGTMVASGVPIVDSLDIVAKTSGNMTVEKAILHVKDRISEGQNMVDPLMEVGIFPQMVVQMIGVGEATGALDTMLNKIADFYEDEVDVAVENLTSLLEPVLMVFLGTIVGGMLIAMYLPIFEMAGEIEG